MHFGASLRLLRVAAGWSLRDLSGAIGVTPAYLSRVEHGHDAPPTPDRLRSIAGALGVPGELLADLTGRAQPAASSIASRAVAGEVERRGLTPSQVARLLGYLERHFPAAAPSPEGMAGWLGADRVLREVRVPALTDAVDLAAGRLAVGIDADQLVAAFRAVQLSSTTVGGGLSLPHVAIGRPAACLVLLAAPVPSPTPDDLPVRAVLALTGVPCGPEGLVILGRAARLGDAALLTEVAAAPDVARSIEVLRVFESAWR